MSYSNTVWISDYTYRYLRAEASTTAAETMALAPQWAQATEYLMVSGVITLADQSAELYPFYRLAQIDSSELLNSYRHALASAGSQGTYSLVLEDASGVALYTHAFTATTMSLGGPAPVRAHFGEIIPYTPAARVVLKQGATELASRPVSAHAPSVTLLAPNGGEKLTERMDISWTASDADGDVLHFTVQYSPDNGQTWRVIAADRTATSVQVTGHDFGGLPGGEQALVRVIATDGVNTGQDQSDAVFAVVRKPPLAHILEPVSGSRFEPGSAIVFRATGMDAEDLSLYDTGTVSWSSNLSGELGTGWEIWAKDLTIGAHHISMSLTDSNGQIGTDTVTIYVGISPEKTYLPVVLRSQ
jgi:hypothetical protein